MSYLENDAYVPNYEKAFDFIVRNQDLPTLVFLYSVHTDHAGHAHKWMSAEYIKSIEEADIQIGAFIDKMKKKVYMKIPILCFCRIMEVSGMGMEVSLLMK